MQYMQYIVILVIKHIHKPALGRSWEGICVGGVDRGKGAASLQHALAMIMSQTNPGNATSVQYIHEACNQERQYLLSVND